MKDTRKIMSTVLTVAAIICFICAGILFFIYNKEDRQANITTENIVPTETEETSIDETIVNETLETDSSPEEPDIVEEEIVSDSDLAVEENNPQEEPSPEPVEEPVIPNPYAESFLANEDMAGWLVVPGTVIDYPIMWTPEDEEYYLYKGFDKKKNSNGCLILDTDSCTNPLTTNLIIHGHNMKSGAMFGNLTDYESKEYFEEHKSVILHTKECQRNYEVIAVFYSQVYKKTDDVFKFYKFFQAETEEEFYDFYNNIKELSLYDTGVTAEFGDKFITLSTCAYHVERGRFVVVAKEVEPGATYLPF